MIRIRTAMQIALFWERFRSSLWFVPAVMAGGGAALAFSAVALDESVDHFNRNWIYTGGPEGARAVLSTIAGSMITVAGVVFSITIVAMTLAASQFGPRLLRNFLRDTANQIVLGTFTSTFLYCLLVLRTVRGDADDKFVPNISVTLGVLLAVASLVVLIYFIHHVSIEIQVTNVVKDVSVDLRRTIDRLFPERIGEGPNEVEDPDGVPRDFENNSSPVAANESGYLQGVEDDRLMHLAVEHDFVLKMAIRPGQFVIEGVPVAAVWPGDRLTEDLERKINDAFVLGRDRTPAQDVEFAISQLVEIAVRALSPGVNDPFTAINCLDWLSTGLCRLADRRFPSAQRYDDTGALRVIAEPVSFRGVVEAAFNQVRQAARKNEAVSIRLLELIAEISRCVRTQENRDALSDQAEMIWKGSRRASGEQADRRDIDERYDQIREMLDQTRKRSVQDPPDAARHAAAEERHSPSGDD